MTEPRDDAGHPDDAARETAILYALGALTPEEVRAFEEHAARCEACATEARAQRDVVGALSLAAASSMPAPPASLREKVLSAAGKPLAEKATAKSKREEVQVWKSWKAAGKAVAPGFFVQLAGEGSWEETAAKGVRVKPLHVDPGRKYATMLVRMDPGSAYPRHVHAGAEECFVLEGDLRVGGVHLHAGDYQCAEEGSEHEVQSTDGGCLLLILSSQEDRLV